MKKVLGILSFLVSMSSSAQDDYRATTEKKFDLEHTKLKVSFNLENSTMEGEEWVTLSPHFYEQDQLVLDAKSMLIHKVSTNGKSLVYDYKNNKLTINLPKSYSKNEKLTVYLQYTAQPDKVEQEGSAAITSAKGLYFIDPRDEDPDKPTQIWTQGETESSSCWFPTIDKPNQKTSQEIYITVPKRFVTLSNGELVNKTDNSNGTRTDYWNFKQKHAPYLFFMGIGEFEIIKDTYKGKEVDYYVEEKYAPYAQEIFGDTPEMLKHFSKLTGVEYPWNKYAQIVCRDYVSGAMENTTAVIHGTPAYQTSGQLVDENRHESIIAHEIFHHWFGDLVTSESWSNLTVNESFANYSEYLWFEYKYGKDYADAHMLEALDGYKAGKNFDKHLVRFNYSDKEEMFDAVSYNKGGGILHMLRNYIGDEAFFASIKTYLEENKYKAAEAHQLRLAFEKVTGKDLNPFFNQWYFNSGHPKLDITYDYNTSKKEVTVNIKQNQTGQVFEFPFAIDIFEKGTSKRENVFVTKKEQSFTFTYNKKPIYIQSNADGLLLCDINETKTLNDYINQLKYATHYQFKRDALNELIKNQKDTQVFNAVFSALNDKFYKVRKLASDHIDLTNRASDTKVINKLKQLATSDEKTLVQASAIKVLGELKNSKFKSLFKKGLESKSCSVLEQSLIAVSYLDKSLAINTSKNLPVIVKETISYALAHVFADEKDESQLEFVAGDVLAGIYFSSDKESKALYGKLLGKIARTNHTRTISKLATDIVEKGLKYKKYKFDQLGIQMLSSIMEKQKEMNQSNSKQNIKTLQTALKQLKS